MNFRFVDLFCGGGGSVSGAIDALNAAGVRYEGRCFNHWDVAMPFMTEYYKNGRPVGVDQPIPTISTKDRFGVVQGRILTLPDGRRYQLDITHRMLSTRELADATGFDHDYVFQGTDTDAKKQIGNAVPPPLARALYLAALSA